MKIIFLDIDGVLNHDNWPRLEDMPHVKSLASREMLDPECVGHLNAIIARTGARCVVSSTWRTVTPWPLLQKVLDSAGFDGLLIGATVDLKWAKPRGHEIDLWVQAHQDEIDSFIILDDRDDMHPHLERLVQTNEEIGLTRKDAERAVRLLKGGHLDK